MTLIKCPYCHKEYDKPNGIYECDCGMYFKVYNRSSYHMDCLNDLDRHTIPGSTTGSPHSRIAVRCTECGLMLYMKNEEWLPEYGIYKRDYDK